MKSIFLSDFFYYYKVFKRYTGRRLYLLTTVIIIGGTAEGIGILLFIPLLNQNKSTSMDVVSLNFYRILDFLHIPPTFNYVLLIILVVFIVKAIIILIQQSLNSYIMSELTKSMRQQIISSYINMKYSYYLNKNVGYLNNVITTETERAVGAFGHYCLCLVAIIYVLIYSCSSFIINHYVTMIALFSGILIFYSLSFLNNMSRRYSLLTSEKNASLQTLLIQAIQSFKYLKATNSFKRIKHKLDEEIKALANYSYKLGLIGGSLASLSEALVIILLVGLIFFQVSVMGKDIVEIMVMVLLLFRLVSRLYSLQHTWQQFNVLTGGIETFANAYEEAVENAEKKGIKRVGRLNKEIRLENIGFRFANKPVLHDINMEISKNKVIAIVGESGSGKTTLVDLITGLLKPESGSIYFDGIDYEDIDPDSIRKMVGYVTQENVVFHDTIANNISLWEHHEDDTIYKSKVHKAAQAAYCDEYVKDKELGYDTIIGDRGIKLSGGQRQRLSIARELFKEPELLIFDEATSALDSESESFIQKSIDNLKGSKTIIIIAHRLSTIKNSDYVYVLNKGRIIEEGKYSELYNGNTRFRKMCLDQQL